MNKLSFFQLPLLLDTFEKYYQLYPRAWHGTLFVHILKCKFSELYCSLGRTIYVLDRKARLTQADYVLFIDEHWVDEVEQRVQIIINP